MKTTITTVLTRFHGDRRGATLTEFVICLPAFIMIFAGAVKLYGINTAGMQVKREAYVEMWGKSVDTQRRLFPELSSAGAEMAASLTPITGAGQAAVWHLGHNDVAVDTAADIVLDVPIELSASSGVGLAGHMPESNLRTVLYQSFIDEWSYDDPDQEPTPFETHQTIQSLFGHVDPPHNEGLNANGTAYTEMMLDDTLDRNGPTLDVRADVLGYASRFLNGAGVRPSVGAGMRYGIVGGASRRRYTIAGPAAAQLNADYHVAAPPRATSRYITIAVVRTLFVADEDRSFNTEILKFRQFEPYLYRQTSDRSYDTGDCADMEETLATLNPNTNGLSLDTARNFAGQLGSIGDTLDGLSDNPCGRAAFSDGQGQLNTLFSDAPNVQQYIPILPFN